MHSITRALCAAAVALLAAAPAGAIVGGDVDSGAHPEVGALYAPGAAGPEIACSGTLVAPDVFLTAGHCTAGLDRVWISLDAVQTSAPTLVAGTAHTHPAFAGIGEDDLGVVVLDRPVEGVVPAGLPAAAAVAGVAKRSTVTVAGYGYHDGADGLAYDGARRTADVTAHKVSKTALTVDGGPCFGDSGGPMYLPGTRTVAAVTSGGKKRDCTGKAAGQRVDTTSARAFLSGFVALP